MSPMSGRNIGSIELRQDTINTDFGQNSRTDGVKFGIRTPLRGDNDKGELVNLYPEQSISHPVATVCQSWGFPDPTIFALKFTEPPGHYVTEATRKELCGKLVTMYYSPTKVCEDIISKLKSDKESIRNGLKELSANASDPTVADKFVKLEGLTVLLDLLEKDKLTDKEMGLANALQSLLDIMLLSDATWDKLHSAVVSKVCSYVNAPKGVDKAALGPALQVLESAVQSGMAYAQVEKEVTLGVLVTHVQNNDLKVQQNALALVNALLMKADPLKRRSLATTLASRKYRDIVLQFVINNKTGDRLSETNHELYVMQTIFLNLLEERRQTAVDPQDQDALNKIKELFRIAFESETGNYSAIHFETNNLSNGGSRKDKPNFKRDYQRLGFVNDSNPAYDFSTAPPGALALDCMFHLATTHTENYSKIVLESACRSTGDECPFAKSSIALVNVLCDIMKMGEPPGDQQGKFYPFYFQHDKPFEELYCVCAQLVTKTWKEMRATMEDFDKVFDVVREQIKRALEKVPDNFDILKTHLNTLTYQEITNLRQQERTNREEWELQAKPIQELRKRLEPEMIELIKQNRLNYLIAGTRFNKFTSRGLTLQRVKEKFWFCRLSNNGKVFHYGDCEEKATPLPEELSNKLNVNDIKGLLTGKDCPHMKESKVRKSNVPLAFSLVTEKEPLTTVDFVAPDEKTFDLWTDGINALLGKDMVSKVAKTDLEVLLHMEIKLRLLDIEGVPEIPQEPPEIPPLPQNFDFSALQLSGIPIK